MPRIPRSLTLLTLLAAGACGGAAAEPDAPTRPAPTAPAPTAPDEPTPSMSACSGAELAPELAPMVGTWRGGGWIELRPGQREEFSQVEDVRCALGGELLIIAGQARSPAGQVVHQAFGVISPRAEGGHQMRAYSAGRPVVDTPLERAEDGSLSWATTQGPVALRFSIRIDGGVWREIGEASFQDGPFRQFFSSELRRVEAANLARR